MSVGISALQMLQPTAVQVAPGTIWRDALATEVRKPILAKLRKCMANQCNQTFALSLQEVGEAEGF